MSCTRLHGRAIKKYKKGFLLVEVIIVSALILLVFGAVASLVRTNIALIGVAKARTTALALGNDRLEYIRSLNYDAIGTVAGVPSGNLPQNRTIVQNDMTFNERLLIQYIDNDADGYGSADTNGILADYKQVKVEYTYTLRNTLYTQSITADIMPYGIETTAGGGTIRVNVFNAETQPVAGAAVRFINNSLIPAIDTTRYTDATGQAYLSGAPAGASYEISVSKSGYTTDGTYTPDAIVVAPNTPPLAVLVGQISTMNFQIDEMSTIAIVTRTTPTMTSVTETYSDASGITGSNSINVTAGKLVLQDSGGIYAGNGYAQHATVTPVGAVAWYDIVVDANVPNQTAVVTHVYYDDAGTLTIVPDTVLPGNSSGFTSDVIDIHNIDLATYGTLSVRAELTTNNTTLTPEVLSYSLRYVTSQSPIGSIDFQISGTKTLGTDASAQPVRKYNEATSTDASGENVLANLEWDSYSITMTDTLYTVSEVCPNSPYTLFPGTFVPMTMDLVAAVPYALRVSVVDTNGNPMPNATVRVQNGGYDVTEVTLLCGQVLFTTGLFSGSDYTITVSKSGYTTQVLSGVSVNDDTAVATVTLN